jgi:hypothetical protein
MRPQRKLPVANYDDPITAQPEIQPVVAMPRKVIVEHLHAIQNFGAMDEHGGES